MEITLEQVERLCEKANVSYSQAKAALEHSGGNLLDALIWLEQQGFVKPPKDGGQYSTPPQSSNQEVFSEVIAASEKGGENRASLEKLLELLRDLVRRGIENELVVTRGSETVVSIPVLVVIALLLVAFWISLPLLLLGFILGCRYRFSGPDLDRREVNRVMDTVNNTANDVREQVISEMHRHQEKRDQKDKK